jgi:3-dehydroquinate synthase
MESIRVNTKSHSYEVNIDSGNLINNLNREKFCALTKARKIALITDDNVDKHYGEAVKINLEKLGFTVYKFVFKSGEASKTLQTFGEIIRFLAKNGLTRSDAVLALGGGVTGDLAGFAAASYQRGIDLIQCPTSLLAMVDSSVGGKTAVDLPEGKNLAGAFYQPKAVICDVSALQTLPDEFFRDGLGEVIKCGAIRDTAIFDILERNTPEEIRRNPDSPESSDSSDSPESLIAACVRIKRDIVETDEFDRGDRALLNFGHTIGHAIEKLYGFTGITHGVAVANGMVFITKLSEKMGLTKPGTAERIENLNKKYGIHRDISFSKEAIADAAFSDKKRGGDDISLVFIKEIGDSFVYKMAFEEFRKNFISL